MEALGAAFGKGFAVAARLGIRVFRTAVFNALFLLDEEDLALAIEEDVDLLGLFLIHASQYVNLAQQFVGKIGKGSEKKITLENSLKWIKEECDRKGTRHYDVIVNLPEGAEPAEGVFPPPGYDKKSVEWFWKNVQRLMNYVFYGKTSKVTKEWGVEHLKWLVQQQTEGKTKIEELLNKGHKEADARAKKKEGPTK